MLLFFHTFRRIGYIESYTDTVPKKDGETNISEDLIGVPYAEVEDGMVSLRNPMRPCFD